MRKLLNRLLPVTLAKKLMCGIVLTALTLSAIVIYTANRHVNMVLVENLSSSFEQMLDLYISGARYKLQVYSSACVNLSSNPQLREGLSNFSQMDEAEIEAFSQEIVTLTKSIQSINFTHINKLNIYPISRSDFVQDRYLAPLTEKEKNQPWYRNLNQKPRQFEMYTKSEMGYQILALALPIYDLQEQEMVGILKMELFPSRIFRVLTYNDYFKIKDIFLIDSKGNVAYTNNVALSNRFLSNKQFDSLMNMGSHVMTTSEGRFVVSNSNANGLYGVLYLPNESIRSYQLASTIRMTLTMVMATVAILILGLQLVKKLSRRFGLLVYKLDHLDLSKAPDQWNSAAPIEGKDEIALVDQHISDLIERIQQLVQENYLQQALAREAEFRALTAQINPHFLYNSLETVSDLALIGENEKAADAAASLGELLRYNLGSDREGPVRLEQELSSVQNYLAIQRLRFGDKIRIEIAIPERCLHYNFIRFILQPVVENCFTHAFVGLQGEGVLKISMRERDGWGEITVSDNGLGMSEDKAQALREELKLSPEELFTDKNRHIGLANVNARLKLAYGPKSGLSFTTHPDRGSAFTLRFPLEKEKKAKKGAKGVADTDRRG